MSKNSEAAGVYLARAMAKDIEKGSGCAGMRTTREVADAISLSMGAARRALWELADGGAAECFDGGASGEMGNPIFWQIKKASS